MSTRSYFYTVYLNDAEIVTYHFHPDAGVPFCHMHLRGVAGLSKVHFPTGRVAIEEFIAMLIRDFDVKPRRTDYEAVLAEGLAKFHTWRTWS